jgi:hypothetical protein
MSCHSSSEHRSPARTSTKSETSPGPTLWYPRSQWPTLATSSRPGEFWPALSAVAPLVTPWRWTQARDRSPYYFHSLRTARGNEKLHGPCFLALRQTLKFLHQQSSSNSKLPPIATQEDKQVLLFKTCNPKFNFSYKFSTQHTVHAKIHLRHKLNAGIVGLKSGEVGTCLNS